MPFSLICIEYHQRYCCKFDGICCRFRFSIHQKKQENSQFDSVASSGIFASTHRFQNDIKSLHVRHVRESHISFISRSSSVVERDAACRELARNNFSAKRICACASSNIKSRRGKRCRSAPYRHVRQNLSI